MDCFKGLKDIKGKKILVIHGSVTQRERNAYPIHMDFINRQITFDMDRCDATTIAAVATAMGAYPNKKAPKKPSKKKKKGGK